MASVKDGNSWDIPFEQRYSKEFPADKTHLAKAWKLLESYSGIPPAEIEAHVMAIVSIQTPRQDHAPDVIVRESSACQVEFREDLRESDISLHSERKRSKYSHTLVSGGGDFWTYTSR